MKHLIRAWALGLMLSLTLPGCTSMFTAKTKATVTTPEGFTATYESDKEYQGIDAEYDPVTKRFHLRVEKSGTPEQAIAAAVQSNAAVAAILEKLAPFIAKAAALGAGT